MSDHPASSLILHPCRLMEFGGTKRSPSRGDSSMARVPLVNYEDAPPEIRAIFERNGNPERALNVTRLIANPPDFLAGFTALVQGLYQHNTLSPRLRELAYLRASQLNGCHY